jgi:hypothetical protein
MNESIPTPQNISTELPPAPHDNLGEVPLSQFPEQPNPPAENTEPTPYYALDEEEIRRKIAEALMDAPDKPAPGLLIQENDAQPRGLEEDIVKAEVMARAMNPHMIAAKAKFNEAEDILESMKPVGESLKNNAVFLATATLRQPLKMARATKRLWSAATLEDKAWNAAQIVGTKYDRMVAATLPFVQKVDVLDILPTRPQAEVQPDTPEQPDKKFSLATEQLTEQLHLDEQLAEQLSVLYKTGIVEQLPSGKFGFQAEDGQTFEAPTPYKVRELVQEHTELIRYKARQGFTRLLVVPSAAPSDRMIESFQDRVITHFQEGNLHDSRNEAVDLNPFAHGTPRKLRVVADKSKRLTIKDLGDKSHTDKIVSPDIEKEKSDKSEHGWSLMLVKSMPELPMEPKDVVSLGGRGEFLSGIKEGLSPEDYIHMLRTNQLLRCESGMTLNAWLTYAMAELKRNSMLIDSHSGTVLLGSYAPGSILTKRRVVPWVGWGLEPTKGGNPHRDREPPLIISAINPRRQQSAGMRTVVELRP